MGRAEKRQEKLELERKENEERLRIKKELEDNLDSLIKKQNSNFNSDKLQIIIGSGLQLNSLIFCSVIEYLTYKATFKELIELSLISKQSFKIIQNTINKQSKQQKITLGNKKSVQQYIENSINNSNNNSVRLIQYQEIEFIRCRDEINDKSLKFSNDNQYTSVTARMRASSVQFKQFLNKNCPLVKNVHIVMYLRATHYTYPDVLISNKIEKQYDDFYDYTENGFYSFDGLYSRPDSLAPVSNQEEYIAIKGIREYHNRDKRSVYPFTYEFVKKYQPTKLYLVKGNSIYYNFDNILNYKYIQTIEFQDEPTTSTFIVKALKCDHIKSLSINFLGGEIGDTTIIGDWQSKLIESLDGLSSNSTLNKLVLNYSGDTGSESPKQILQFIKTSGNKSISKLGLHKFIIQDSAFLSTLIEIPTINTLYFNYEISIIQKRQNETDQVPDFNCQSFVNGYLKHIVENQNLTTFKITVPHPQYYYVQYQIDNFTNAIIQFFSMKSTITKLVLTLSQSKTKYYEYEQMLYQKLIESGNTNLKLFIKYQ